VKISFVRLQISSVVRVRAARAPGVPDEHVNERVGASLPKRSVDIYKRQQTPADRLVFVLDKINCSRHRVGVRRESAVRSAFSTPTRDGPSHALAPRPFDNDSNWAWFLVWTLDHVSVKAPWWSHVTVVRYMYRTKCTCCRTHTNTHTTHSMARSVATCAASRPSNVPRRQHVEDARLLHELFGRAATFKRAAEEG
jgi:hypothetical protein